MRPAEVFVRSLSHQEAVKLKRMSTRAEHQSTRIRAAILSASNVNATAGQARYSLSGSVVVRIAKPFALHRRQNSVDRVNARPSYRRLMPLALTRVPCRELDNERVLA